MIEHCAIATMDGPRHDQGGTEYRDGHIVVTGGQISAVGEGPAREVPEEARRVDGTGCLATPGELRTADVAAAVREVRAARDRLADPR